MRVVSALRISPAQPPAGWTRAPAPHHTQAHRREYDGARGVSHRISEDLVDAVETVWDYAYETKEAEELANGKPEDAGFDENDMVDNALIDVEFAMESLRDMFSPHSHAPDGYRSASEVLVGKPAGTITIVRRSSPEDVEYQAARQKAEEPRRRR